MRTVITGGAGFLGSLLAQRLVAAPATAADPAGSRRVVVADRQAPVGGPPPGTEFVAVDVCGADASLDELVAGADAVVHLASVVSADAEADPDRAWAVNVEATRRLLASCGRTAPGCRFLAASSVAVFAGGDGPATDRSRPAPASTYGMTKAILELLVDEATRRGTVDGRTARLPTVIIRPGRPNLAASSFASGLFREPLAGLPSVVPVRPEVGLVVIGHRAAVAGLQALLEVPSTALGPVRALNLPGLEVTVAGMIAACRDVAVARDIAAGPITVAPDPAIEAIVATWPSRWDAGAARSLGLPADRSLEQVVTDYLGDLGPGRG